MNKGIDVSYAQNANDMDYNVIKSDGINFVIARAGYGRLAEQKDKQFDAHYDCAKKSGLGVGCYWFSYAMSADEAVLEAKACLSVIKGKSFDYPVCFDIEYPQQLSLGKNAVSDIIKAFCTEIENAGYYVSVYASANVLNNSINLDILERFDIWVAHYDVEKPNYNGDYGIWQYKNDGAIKGYNGDIDCNYGYKDYPSIMRENGLNGGQQPSETETIIYTVKEGDTLWDISEEYLGDGNRYTEIMSLNNLTSDVIYPDQTLKIPS